MTAADLTMVVMAAGMGSRFGGQKQWTGLGPRGETLLDYAIHDGLRAGVGRVVLIVSPQMEAEVAEHFAPRWAGTVPVELAVQRLDDLPGVHRPPTDRIKPWGTGQAVLAVRDVVDGPFLVLNADDFYGRSAYAAIAEFLGAADQAAIPHFALQSYHLGDTLPDTGSVTRGPCQVSAAGLLESVVEHHAVERRGHRAVSLGRPGGDEILPLDAVVSMNIWGFTPALFPLLEAGFAEFLAASGTDLKAEYLLPLAVERFVIDGHVRVQVLPAISTWFGVTNPEDRELVAGRLLQLHEQGVYPEDLYQ